MLKDLLRVLPAAMVAGVCSMVAPTAFAQDQAQPSLQEQLAAQYQVAKISPANGCTLATPGTQLTVQKPNVFAVPLVSVIGCPTKYEDGKVKSPNVFCKAMVKQAAGSFQAGQLVYPLKIDVNSKQEKISFSIASCDQGISWKGEIVFQFAKDYLEKAGVTEVEDKISELLALASDNTQQAQAPPPSPGQDQGQPADQPAPSQPITIQIGQTRQDVENAMGQPEKRVDLGAKQIYVYKDLKITFVDGKVSDVQ
jgi:hypothetical protein